jgi:hypothetical protein
MRSTPPPADGDAPGPTTRCRSCGAEHPAGFTFCLECGERVRGSQVWPRSPVPLRLAALRRGCPACRIRLHEVIYGFLDGHEKSVSQDDDEDDEPAQGLVEYSVGNDPTHECRQCGRQFWLVRSQWDGWRRQVAWRTVTTARALRGLLRGRVADDR